MDNLSLWESISDKAVTYPKLSQNLEVDVAIIGAGITGITAALQLVNAGKKVVILEADRVGSGTTGFSTGNLYVPVQPYFQNIVNKFDLQTAKIIAQSRQFAIDYIEKNIQEKNISCNFSRRPWFLYTSETEKIPFLTKEVDVFKKMDFTIDYTTTLPLSLKFKKAAVLQNQARFNPLQYVRALAADLEKNNCKIFENSRVLSIEEKNVCTLKTADAKVTAKNVLIATHTPIGINPIQLFTAPYRSYVVAVHVKDNIYPEGHFWDLDASHHAICTHATKPTNHPDLLLIAGSHHRTGQGKNMRLHYEELETYMRKHFAISEIAYRWSAQHYQAADDVPYIGLANHFAKHTYMATGFFADGLVYGTLAGIIISDLMQRKSNQLAETYNAQRFTPAASATFVIKESSNIFLQYLKDYPLLTSKKYNDIKIGEGKIVEIDSEKYAVSRDHTDQLHIVSAVCTHMKCIVNWNNAEKTWDCPCHGSRFTQTGKVIEGPAKMDLEKKK